MPDGIEKTRLKFQLLGQAGEEVDKTLKVLAQSQDQLAAKFQTYDVGKSVEELKRLSDEARKSREQIDLLVASVVLPIKVAALQAIAEGIQSIVAAVKEADDYSGSWIVGFLRARGTLGGYYDENTGRVIPRSAIEHTLDDIQSIDKRIDELQAKIAAGGTQTGRGVRLMGDLPQQLDAAVKEREELNARLQRINDQSLPKMPPVTVTARKDDGSNPPPIAGGGGAGGRSDADDVEALIKRYQAMQKAAEDATAAVRTNQQADIDDLARVVQAKQETQDILARIAQHKTIPPELQKALEDAIFGAKQAQAETQKSIQYNQQAFELEKRLGDGTVAYTRALRDLNREKATGRLSDEAYNRALKEQTEAIQNAALAAKRYDDDLGSLGAGFEQAANQYARAHDLFTAGGQIFTGHHVGDGRGPRRPGRQVEQDLRPDRVRLRADAGEDGAAGRGLAGLQDGLRGALGHRLRAGLDGRGVPRRRGAHRLAGHADRAGRWR